MATELVIEELNAHEFDTCCELGDGPVHEAPQCDRPVRWIMHRKPCCARSMYPALACDQCKEQRLMDVLALECEGCGHIYEHSAEAYTYIEAFKKS